MNPAMRQQAVEKLKALGKPREVDRMHAAEVAEAITVTAENRDLKKLAKQLRVENKREKIPKLSDPEERLAFHLKAVGIAGFVRQYRWCQGRAFRADFAFVPERLLVEVQGGIHIRGARSHTGIKGYEYDRSRQNEAVVLGWRVLEFTPRQIKCGLAVDTIKRALGL